MTVQTPETLGDDWVRPRPTRQGYRADVVLALVLLALGLFSTVLYRAAGFYDEPATIAVSVACVSLPCLVLIARRRFPLLVLLVTATAFIVTQMLQVPEILVSNIVLFIALYTAGAWPTNRRAALVVRLLVIVSMFVWLFWALVTSPLTFLDDGPGVLFISSYVAFGLISLVTNLLYFGGAYYFGDRAWFSARGAAELKRRSADLARERERNAAQAVLGERIRIARDLHDVVAHHVSLMGVQAGAARRLFDTAPDRALASLTAVEASAREAVSELNRMLGTLREPGGDGAVGPGSTSPSTHRLSGVEGLVEDARAAGLAARFTVVGEPRDLPFTVEATLYRVAQEAVTNTLKHAAPSASLDLRIRYLPDAVELEASDTGGSARSSTAGAGLGLVGMRERLAAVGGSLETGPRARGGFLVRARVGLDRTDTE